MLCALSEISFTDKKLQLSENFLRQKSSWREFPTEEEIRVFPLSFSDSHIEAQRERVARRESEHRRRKKHDNDEEHESSSNSRENLLASASSAVGLRIKDILAYTEYVEKKKRKRVDKFFTQKISNARSVSLSSLAHEVSAFISSRTTLVGGCYSDIRFIRCVTYSAKKRNTETRKKCESEK